VEVIEHLDPDLSPTTEDALTVFVSATRRVVARHEDSASSIRTLLDRLEEARQGRFENSTKTVPGVFWWSSRSSCWPPWR
jgi:hypothetical protein